MARNGDSWFDVTIHFSIPRRKRATGRLQGWVSGLPVLLLLVLIVLIAERLDEMGWLEWLGVALILVMGVILLVIIFYKRQIQKKLIRLSGIAEIDQMSGTAFTQVIADFFRKEGFAVEDDPDGNKHGADFILKKDGQTVAVQTKRYKNNVGIAAVEEVIDAGHHYKTDHTLVVANRAYTKPAEQLAMEFGVLLWDRQMLMYKLAEQAEAEGTKQV